MPLATGKLVVIEAVCWGVHVEPTVVSWLLP